MDIPKFKKVFDSLDEEGQKNVISQLSDRELEAISNYKPQKAHLEKAQQYAGSAIESALSTPALMSGAGFLAGGPPGALAGLAIGTRKRLAVNVTTAWRQKRHLKTQGTITLISSSKQSPLVIITLVMWMW